MYVCVCVRAPEVREDEPVSLNEQLFNARGWLERTRKLVYELEEPVRLHRAEIRPPNKIYIYIYKFFPPLTSSVSLHSRFLWRNWKFPSRYGLISFQSSAKSCENRRNAIIPHTTTTLFVPCMYHPRICLRKKQILRYSPRSCIQHCY